VQTSGWGWTERQDSILARYGRLVYSKESSAYINHIEMSAVVVDIPREGQVKFLGRPVRDEIAVAMSSEELKTRLAEGTQ